MTVITISLVRLTEWKSLIPPSMGDIIEKWDLMVVLIYIFLISSKMEHCSYLFPILGSSYVCVWFISIAHFSIGYFGFYPY